MAQHKIFAMTFAKVYPLYVQKAERKGRTKEEVDQIICWLTGYEESGLQEQVEQENDLETFFARKKWNGEAFLAIMKRYNATPEMFYHRLTNILPHYFVTH